MSVPESHLHRRMVLTMLAAGGCLLPAFGKAAGLTGVLVLDTAAIQVRNPSGVFLVAIARAGNRFVAVGEQGIIVFSDDDGATWRQAQVPVDVTLTCVGFATPLVGWAAGHFGVVLNTQDGGETWTVQLNGIQANQLILAAAQQSDADNSQLPGAPLAMKRANAFVDSGPSKPFLSLLVYSPQKIMVFGAYRMTMLTTDGGKTWVDWSLHVYDPLSHALYGARFIGANAYLVGEEGLVFCSTDNGNSFPMLTAPGTVTLFGIIGANDGSIIAYGVSGAAFRSTDGCKTWTTLNVATQDDITTAAILPSGAVLLASGAGDLFISHDNGTNFAIISGRRSASIFDLAQTQDGKLIVAGNAGVSSISENF